MENIKSTKSSSLLGLQDVFCPGATEVQLGSKLSHCVCKGSFFLFEIHITIIVCTVQLEINPELPHDISPLLFLVLLLNF